MPDPSDKKALISTDEAIDLLACKGEDFYRLMARAGACRLRNKGEKVRLCGIINAKSGRCSEDCVFCAQSARHSKAVVDEYPLVAAEQIVKRGRELAKDGVAEYSIVTSGKSMRSEKEIETVCRALSLLKDEGLVSRCASLGVLPEEVLERFKSAGLVKYHHNLETARSHFPDICTTHAYDEDVKAVEAAHAAGLSVCSGGLFGLGETDAQRVELARTLIDLEVGSVPVNFLNPIPGTPIENTRPLTPIECLKIIAVYRLMMPDKDIYICGGREKNLGDLQSWIFMAGANGLMVGDYLTTSGRSMGLDLKMIRDQGLEPMSGGV